MALFQVRKRGSAVKLHDYGRTDGVYSLAMTYLSLLLFTVGVFAPCFSIYPKFGGGLPEWVAKMLDPQATEPQTFSMIGGISHMLSAGDWLIGGILLLFSLLFPAGKLMATFYLLHSPSEQARRHASLLSHLGKWSMLDVFVIAGIVISFKAFPLGTRIEPRWGIWVFAISVLLSMLATWMLKRQLHQTSDK